jgi:hypothetical protein
LAKSTNTVQLEVASHGVIRERHELAEHHLDLSDRRSNAP